MLLVLDRGYLKTGIKEIHTKKSVCNLLHVYLSADRNIPLFSATCGLALVFYSDEFTSPSAKHSCWSPAGFPCAHTGDWIPVAHLVVYFYYHGLVYLWASRLFILARSLLKLVLPTLFSFTLAY